jgi:bifunctional enzyme CysN/CysC
LAVKIHAFDFSVNQAQRASLAQQQPLCVWMTGLPCSGKSSIANWLEVQLHSAGFFTYLLDGDRVRGALNRDLGFSQTDRAENVRRLSQVAQLMVDAGLVVLVSAISPFAADRAQARSLFRPGQFIEVFVDTPLHVCEQRDVKGLYARARRGELPQFTGIDSPYEPPLLPDVRIVESQSIAQAAEQVLQAVRARQGVS